MSKTRLSIRGGSGYPIQKLMWCPRYVKNKMDGWSWKKKPLYFAEGSIFHSTAESILKEEFTKEYTVDEHIEYLQESLQAGKWENQNGEEIEFDADEPAYPNRDSELTKGDQAAKRVSHGVMKITETKANGEYGPLEDVQIEELVEIDTILNPMCEETDDTVKKARDEGIVISGRIDIFNDLGIQDLKTHSPSSTPTAENNEQLLHYAYLKTIQEGSLVENGIIHAFSKHITKCEYTKSQTKFKTKDFVRWYKNLLIVLEAWLDYTGRDYWPRRGSLQGCRDTYMQLCEFHPVCYPDRYSGDARAEAMQKLKKFD